MKFKHLIIAVAFLTGIVSLAFAAWDDDPELESSTSFSYDHDTSEHHLLKEKVSAGFTYNGEDNKQLFELEPYYEASRNLRREKWQRQELGLVIGKDVLPWFYLGQAIQAVWSDEDHSDYRYYQEHNVTEAITRLTLSKDIFTTKLKGFISNDYIYEFDSGAGVRNEVMADLSYPVFKNTQAGMDWRHIDRVHNYDSDTLETFLNLRF